MIETLVKILDGWRRRERARRALLWSVRGLLVGAVLVLFTAVFAIPRAWLLRSEFTLLTIFLCAVFFGLFGLVAFAWPVPRLSWARKFDQSLGLDERVSTALELAGSSAMQHGISIELLEKQLLDAIQAAQRAEVRARLPFRLPRLEALVATFLLLGIVLIGFRSERSFLAAQKARDLRQAMQQEAEKLETLQQEIENDATLTPEQRESLNRALAEAESQLRQARTLEGAVSALQQAEQALQAYDSPGLANQVQALQEAGNQWAESEGSPLQSVGEALAKGDLAAAAEALANAEVVAATAEEAEQQAQELEAAAASLEGTNPEMAGQLRAAAQALREGNAQTAQDSLQAAANALQNTAQQQAQAGRARQAAGQLQSGQAQLAQAAGQNPQTGMNSGQVQGQAQGQNQGQGQGQGQNQGQGSGGAGQGSGNQPATGQQAGNDPIAQNNGPGDGGLQPYEQVYTPQNLGGQGGQEVPLPGSGQPGDTSLGNNPNAAPGAQSGSQVPYVEVFSDYADAYRQSLSNGEVPAHLRGLIRQYFSALEP